MPEEGLLTLVPSVVEGDLVSLAYAAALLALAVVLLVLEIFVVSFGLLLAASLAAAGGAIYFAFAASDLAGWSFAVLVPVLGAVLARWGIRRIQRSGIVPQSEITSDAGYRHVAERIGVGVGSAGTLVTAARPSGRARFAGGECDVQVRGGALERDDEVVVQQIDGPVIFVVAKPRAGEDVAGRPSGAPD